MTTPFLKHGFARAAALALWACAAGRGQSARSVDAILDSPVRDFGVQGQEAKTVLEGIGAGYRFPIIVGPDVQGTVSFEVHDATLRTVLDAICEPGGWSYEAPAGGYLLVRKFITRIYPVDYLQMSQTGSSSTSVNLSESSGGYAAGAVPAGTQLGATPVSGQLQNQTQAGPSTAGNSTLNVSEQNDADFWGRLEADLRSMVGEHESLVVNRFAGLVQVRGTRRTHTVVEAYLRRVLERAGRQARISVKVVEVDLNDQSKTGIDWSVASASLGRIAGTSITASGVSTATAGVTQLGSVSLGADTFTGTIAAGAVQAAISALSEQGTVRVESKPEVAALNNQTAFVQVSEDQPFFSRTSTTTINAGGTAQSGTQPIVSTNYAQSTVSFGNVLEITVQIADDLSTKLSLSPALTELKGTVTSPDGQETAPITGTKRARTTVTLRNHQTAVIGGFITETTAKDSRGIPGLSRIPVLGSAFSTNVSAHSRTELVFLVTVNAEEPPALTPSEVEESAPASSEGRPKTYAPRVQSIDMGGSAS